MKYMTAHNVDVVELHIADIAACRTDLGYPASGGGWRASSYTAAVKL